MFWKAASGSYQKPKCFGGTRILTSRQWYFKYLSVVYYEFNCCIIWSSDLRILLFQGGEEGGSEKYIYMNWADFLHTWIDIYKYFWLDHQSLSLFVTFKCWGSTVVVFVNCYGAYLILVCPSFSHGQQYCSILPNFAFQY